MKKIFTVALIMCAALNILAQQQVHTLADGESLRTVAEKYGVTLEEFKAANPNLGKVLRTGMSVNIPQKQTVAAPVVEQVVEETQYKAYKVGRGDTYAKVAKQYGVSVEDLKAANPKYKKYLVAGSTLQIPVKVKSTKPATTTQSTVSASATSAAASAPVTQTVAATTTTATTGSTGDALRDLELQKAKAEVEKAQAEAELARLQLERVRNGQYSRSYDRGDDEDEDSESGNMNYRGFRIVPQISPSYKSGIFGLGLNVDLGCVVADGLFVGAGPQVTMSTYDGDFYSSGAFVATSHYAFPTGRIRPYIDGHWGYGFEFGEIDNGYFVHNYSVGVQFGNGTFLGLYFDAKNSEYIPALKVGFGMPRTDGSRRVPHERKIVPTRNSGLELSVEGGVEDCKYSLTINDYTYKREPAVWSGSVTLGYRITSKVSAGIGYKYCKEGAGDDTSNGMYARGQYRFFDKRFTPLVEMDFLYDFSDELYYIAPHIGCSFRTTNNSYITCKIGYRRNITHFSGYDESTLNAYGIKIGWTHTFGWLSR